MSRHTILNFFYFVAATAALCVTWWYVDKNFIPKPAPPEKAKPEEVERKPSPRELVQGLAGGVAAVPAPKAKPDPKVDPKPPAVEPPKVEPKPSEPAKIVALGGTGFFKQVWLNSKGASVQQVILPEFEESTREGKNARDANGKDLPLHIIPGIARHREPSVKQQWTYRDLTPNDPELSERSYVLYHYPVVGDPDRLPEPDKEKERSYKPDQYPSPLLGDREWKLVESVNPTDGGDARAVFETELGLPYFIKIRKTYTLSPKDYHLVMKLDFEALPERAALPDQSRVPFKYQICGARGLPIEGEWYTPTHRNTIIGWMTPNGTARRTIEDAASIQTMHGGTAVLPTDGILTFAGVSNQYFASVLAVDDTLPEAVRKNMLAYIRPSREPWVGELPPVSKNPSKEALDRYFLGDQIEKPFLGDITIRAVSNNIDPTKSTPVSHQYLIYNGPLKVRLLKQLTGEREVRPELVDRYLDTLGLKTLADYHSPHFFGRVASSIYWADLVIWFTNLMHSILGFLHKIVPVWGVDILLLTVFVRLMLMVPSRRQQIVMSRMQEKMAAMKPEIDKLQEKYKGDPQRIQQEKTKLMLQNGVNPLSSLSGCFLMLAQMPVFLGLYYCLQESIFFRLDSFLWFPNLAAPDMLVGWTEKIPFISDPSNLNGTIYLGPYLNILPIIAVSLMFIHQKLSMPPAMDEAQEMQQKMMKFMMIFMGFIFYKMAAGLCLYFIVSTSWGLMEKKLLPKPTAKPKNDNDPGQGELITNSALGSPPAPPAGPPGFFGRMKARMEEMQRQADEQSSRQIRNEPRPAGSPQPNRDKKKRKK